MDIRNPTNIWPLPKKSEKDKPLQIDFDLIRRAGYQLVRGYGTNSQKLLNDLNNASSGKLFYSPRIGDVIHHFHILPYSENLSEQPQCGGYHSDFMFQPIPPEFIALLCINPDPKYPVFGRNQIVHMSSFLNAIKDIYGLTEIDLLALEVEYKLPNIQTYKQPIIAKLNEQNIFKLHTSLMSTSNKPLIDGTPFKDMIEIVCNMVSEDLVLDRGDLLLISNHNALHRRSECTLAFDPLNKKFNAREMITIRFDR